MAKKRGVDAIEEQAESFSSGGIFARLENDGDSMIVAFVGAIQKGMKGADAEPASEEYIWKNGRSEEYDPVKHAGEEPRLKIKWNVVQRDSDSAQIWTGSIAFFRDWKKFIDRKGLGHWWEIEREGAKGSKKTKYRLYDIEPLTKEELEDLKKIELRDLDKPVEDDDDDDEDDRPRRARRTRERKAATESRSSAKSSKNDDDDGEEASIDSKQAKELREIVKSFGNAEEIFVMFKKEFGVSKLKSLPASKFEEAMSWIRGLLGKGSQDEEEPEEQDPFE